ncbi:MULTISPECIES: hypothetical protein [unclassified Sphingomonas]|uniref:hypothetical protein n=1 Tax=unclassified Sphingomonas TaxID=196159 RepID=UPI0006F60981|nr:MULTISPECIES: hypothetical protein [unclassified Sphingomonas]KQX26181.1 hypothetical protein ASD17_01595 [Sphingomonas sp. Root1294]KQY69249.1 hypothetical protein ASD39_02795 [Sphingomonas sp. Root50]KRB89503.1 hypothetical protein ASE22_17700 [Sphingomonas sp. Root720]
MPLLERLLDLSGAYGRLIMSVGETTGLLDTLLHVHAGMAIFVLSRLIFRRSFASPVPLACIYLAEALNELLDRLNHGRWMPDTGSDILNTIFWPTIIFAMARYPRGIRRPRL